MTPKTTLTECPDFEQCRQTMADRYGASFCCICCPKFVNYQMGWTDPDAPTFLSWKD